jgi:hypothetical protein
VVDADDPAFLARGWEPARIRRDRASSDHPADPRPPGSPHRSAESSRAT